MRTRPLKNDKSLKTDNFVAALYFLQDLSSDFLRYSRHRHFGDEKWDKGWKKYEGSATGRCVKHAMSCTLCNWR